MTTDKKKVEILKVWYAIFCTLMDGNESDVELLKKLRKLRNELILTYPELEIALNIRKTQ